MKINMVLCCLSLGFASLGAANEIVTQIVNLQYQRVRRPVVHQVVLPNLVETDDDTSWDLIERLRLENGDAIQFIGPCSPELAFLLHEVFKTFDRALTLYFSEITNDFQSFLEEELQVNEYRITIQGYESGHGINMHPGSVAFYLIPQPE